MDDDPDGENGEAMRAARLANSPRLRRTLAALRDAGARGLTTMELAREAEMNHSALAWLDNFSRASSVTADREWFKRSRTYGALAWSNAVERARGDVCPSKRKRVGL